MKGDEHGWPCPRLDAIINLVRCNDPANVDVRCAAAAQMAREDQPGWWDTVWLCASEPMRQAVVDATPDRITPLHALMNPERHAAFIRSWAHEDAGPNRTMARLMTWNIGMDGSSPIWPTMSTWAAGTDCMTVAAAAIELHLQTTQRMASVCAHACAPRLMTTHPQVVRAAMDVNAWSLVADEAMRPIAVGALQVAASACEPSLRASTPQQLQWLDQQAIDLVTKHPERVSLHGYALARLNSVAQGRTPATEQTDALMDGVVKATCLHPYPRSVWATIDRTHARDADGYGEAWGHCIATMCTSPLVDTNQRSIIEHWKLADQLGDCAWSALTVTSSADAMALVMAHHAYASLIRDQHYEPYTLQLQRTAYPPPEHIALSEHGWRLLMYGAIENMPHEQGRTVLQHAGILPDPSAMHDQAPRAPSKGREAALACAAAYLARGESPLALEIVAALCST